MVTDSHQGLGHQLSQIINARHYFLSSSQGNLLVMLFESSCTLWDVIYSDSLNIPAEACGDKWFDEAAYGLSNTIMFWMCSSSDRKTVFLRKRLKSEKGKCYRYIFLQIVIEVVKFSFLNSNVLKEIYSSNCRTVVTR